MSLKKLFGSKEKVQLQQAEQLVRPDSERPAASRTSKAKPIPDRQSSGLDAYYKLAGESSRSSVAASADNESAVSAPQPKVIPVNEFAAASFIGRSVANEARQKSEGDLLDRMSSQYSSEASAAAAAPLSESERHGWDASRSEAGRPQDVDICWPYEGGEVKVATSADNWKSQTPLSKQNGVWFAKLQLQPGDYQYKFIVDSRWCYDMAKPQVASDSAINNLLHVGTVATSQINAM